MTTRSRRTLVGLGGVAALVVLAVALPGPAVEVETAVVVRDSLHVVVEEEGRTRLRDRYVVTAPIGGRLSRIAVAEGDAVGMGEVIARLSPAPEDPRALDVTRAQLSAAEARRRDAVARVEEAEAQHAQAVRQTARRRELAEAGALSEEAREQAELAAATAERQLRSARAALRAAEAEVAAARARLTGSLPVAAAGDAVEVRAPTAGRVLRVLEENERVVPAGTPLVELGNARGLEVVVDVLSEDAVRIEAGDPVRVEGWGGEEVLRGRVRVVEPAAFTKVSALGVEEQRVNVVADLFDPPSALGAGYRVEARVVTWSGEDVLTIPSSALFQQGDEWQTFVVEDGRARRRRVEIGHRGSERVEVTAGLREGDEVILFPSDLIDDGVRVR